MAITDIVNGASGRRIIKISTPTVILDGDDACVYQNGRRSYAASFTLSSQKFGCQLSQINGVYEVSFPRRDLIHIVCKAVANENEVAEGIISALELFIEDLRPRRPIGRRSNEH